MPTPNTRDFKIIVYDLVEKTFYESKKSFDALFLHSLTDRQIVLFEAFHNESSEYKKALYFSDQNFIKQDMKDIYEN